MPDSANVPEASQVAPAAGEPPYRVLIVEDDRAQALFAEGVLNGAGIEALVASEPNDVLATMGRFRPDLVLMDLHMPGLSGTELTAMIRGQEAFLHTPIVFLTGDPDPEKQFEVLESGADDFLSKPIRPRHLVAAVQSRVRRARALGQQRLGDAGRHPLTGLMTRSHLLQRLGNALPSRQRGGVLFVEVEGFGTLRDRFGYAALERLMTEAGRVLAGLVGATPATRLNDNAFLVFAHEAESERLEDLARGLRDAIARHAFEIEGEPLKLRTAIGHVALRHGFTEAGTALEAAEQALRLARLSPIGLAGYQPPANPDAERGRELAAGLRAALAEDRFELAFQPIVAVAGGEEAQYQALLRLRDGDGQLHTAAQIVPAAEAAGLLHDIDRWVLERAVATLRSRGAEQRPLRLFVSQSPRTLARDCYGEWLAACIAEHGVDGPSLVIDVPMADALIHSVTLRQFCEQMVASGVQFCLSRFQHGEEGDALMAQLPLGYVRLAARYSDGNGDGALRDEMRLAIDLAHRQGLQVIGQQVEDPQAAATLWMSGIDYIQGNLVQQAGGDLDFDFQHAVL
ncbi:MAG: EAL domain-containing protein [Gammaproteobacteria bacterium]